MSDVRLRIVIATIGAGALLLGSAALASQKTEAQVQGEKELEAAVVALSEAIQRGDVNAIVEAHSGGAMGYFRGWAIPATGLHDLHAGWKGFFESGDVKLITLHNFMYSVMGDIGVAAGWRTMWFQPKGGPLGLENSRALWTFKKLRGKWQVVSFDESPLPAGRD